MFAVCSHRFWCCRNNDDYSVDTDSCVSINIACSKEGGRVKREGGRSGRCTPLGNCNLYVWVYVWVGNRCLKPIEN